MSFNSADRTKVFISYSHKDARYLRQLQTHLAYYERVGLIEVWDDTKLSPGDVWHEKIKNALKQTKVAILLVSAAFLASKFIVENELSPLLVTAQTEGAIIVSVILSSCAFEDTELAQFQTVNSPSKPLLGMSKGDKEKTWHLVAKTVTEAINSQPSQYAQDKSAKHLLPRDFENETEIAQQLVVDRPRFWEYSLTVELLRSKLQPIKQRLYDLQRGAVYKKTTLIRENEFLDWARARSLDVASLIKVIANAINIDIPTSLGTPGVSGKPLEIKQAVEKLTSACDEMVNWEADVHFSIVPKIFEPLKQKMEGWTTQYIADIEKMLTQMMQVLSEPNTTGTHHIKLTFQPPANVSEFIAELRKLQNNPQILAKLAQRRR